MYWRCNLKDKVSALLLSSSLSSSLLSSLLLLLLLFSIKPAVISHIKDKFYGVAIRVTIERTSDHCAHGHCTGVFTCSQVKLLH